MTATGNSSEYRPHIDGLRAIAVLAVVLFHAGVPGFGGGFVGVDVFFVISGYLIIGLLYREFDRTGDLSLAGFFERRIRRLAPALALVLLASLVLGAFFLTPIGGEQQGLAKSAMATVALVSNLYFAASTGDYFDEPAEAQPLLHTWSLSVEEQFYLFWPLVVLAAGRMALRRGLRPEVTIVWSLVALLLVSFIASVWLTSTHPQWAFYSSPTRAWEFAVGGLVFFWIKNHGQPIRFAGAIAMLGLVAVVAAIALYSADMAFPGYTASLPVLGTAAIILGNEISAQGSWCRRWLSNRALVLVGLASYSFYLWHWPLLVVARLESLGRLGLAGSLAVCAVAFVLALVTLRFVEEPLRRKRWQLIATRRRAWAFALVSTVGIATLAAGLGLAAKLGWSLGDDGGEVQSALLRLEKPKLIGCSQPRPYSNNLVDPINCSLPRSIEAPTILLWGDSHTYHLSRLMEYFSRARGIGARIRFMAGCPPAQGYSPDSALHNGAFGCDAFNADVLREVQQLKLTGLRTVILAGRWIRHFSESGDSRHVEQGLSDTVARLQAEGLGVILLGPLPEFDVPVATCLARRDPQFCGVKRADVDQARLRVMTNFHEVSIANPGLRIVDPVSVFCGADYCPPIQQGEVMFHDDNHLTVAGAMALLPLLGPEIDAALASNGSTDLGGPVR